MYQPSATKWCILQDDILSSAKEIEVRKSWLSFWEQNADGILHLHNNTSVFPFPIWLLLLSMVWQAWGTANNLSILYPSDVWQYIGCYNREW